MTIVSRCTRSDGCRAGRYRRHHSGGAYSRYRRDSRGPSNRARYVLRRRMIGVAEGPDCLQLRSLANIQGLGGR